MAESEKIIHLVSFNIPYPPDYGGVMDVFFKIRALKKQGAGVILHCFSYGRSRSRTLENECLKVHYYHRNLNLFFLFRRKPFIVISRENSKLLADLLVDNHPIIFEGLHTTFYLDHPALDGRFTMVRTHNIEHLYYRNLALTEKNPLRKIFFTLEAGKLENYEAILGHASLLLAISPGDYEYYSAKYGHSLFIGPFHATDHCMSRPGRGRYILIHGDFSTPENNSSALYLLREVVSQWNYYTIIAGRKPSDEIFSEAGEMRHVRVIPNPSLEKMDELISDAQICLLHATQMTGMKLKLISSLYSGRHIIASESVVAGTGLEPLCHVAHTRKEWITLTDKLMNMEFTSDAVRERDEMLKKVADNSINAARIIDSFNHRNVLSK